MVRAGKNRAANSAQQPQLDLARHGQVALQALLLLHHALIELRIFKRDSDLRRQRGHRALVILSEVVQPRVLHIENANSGPLVDQRHSHLRARLRIHHVVARVFADVGDVNHALLADGSAHQTAFQRDGCADGGVFGQSRS